MSRRCEDFPCCGHTDGEGCPDERPGFWPYPCVECGGRIRHGEETRGHESFHARCLNRFHNRSMTGDPDYDDWRDE